MVAAQDQFGEVRDLPFPAVPITAKTEDISALAGEKVRIITTLLRAPGRHAVLCQGEFTLAFQVTLRLLRKGVTVVSAVSERRVTETVEKDVVKKEIVFSFSGFREYSL